MDHFTKYYGALRAIEIRFPVSSDNSHVNINFKWHDAFRDKQTCTQKNIHFEKACILFCMAAIASQKGLDISRKTEAGITEAVKSFALSAGASHPHAQTELHTHSSHSQPLYLQSAHTYTTHTACCCCPNPGFCDTFNVGESIRHFH